jgi:hypothetical protein
LRLKGLQKFGERTIKMRIRASPDNFFAEQKGIRQAGLGEMLNEPIGAIVVRHRKLESDSNQVGSQIP